MKTARMEKSLGKKAVIAKIDLTSPISWLKQGIQDFIKCPGLAVFYGVAFTIVTYFSYTIGINSPLADVTIPLLAFMILILGPISAMSLYDASRRLGLGEKDITLMKVLKAGFRNKGSCPSISISIVLIVLASIWLVFSPLIAAVFEMAGPLKLSSGGNPIVALFNANNYPFMITYGIFTAIVAWISFMISWFAFPMVLEKDVDPITAITTSLRAAMNNKRLMMIWIPIVGILIVVSLLIPYFAGLIVTTPVLAHATWHAYKGMIGELE